MATTTGGDWGSERACLCVPSACVQSLIDACSLLNSSQHAHERHAMPQQQQSCAGEPAQRPTPTRAHTRTRHSFYLALLAPGSRHRDQPPHARAHARAQFYLALLVYIYIYIYIHIYIRPGHALLGEASTRCASSRFSFASRRLASLRSTSRFSCASFRAPSCT